MAQSALTHPRERRPLRILVAEHAQGDLLLLREAFRSRAPQVALHALADGMALLKRLAEEAPLPPSSQSRLLVLDADLRRLDVRALALSLRALAAMPLVLILASDERESDRLACLGSLQARVQVRPVYYGQWLALVESLMPALEERLVSSDIRPSVPLPKSQGVRRPA